MGDFSDSDDDHVPLTVVRNIQRNFYSKALSAARPVRASKFNVSQVLAELDEMSVMSDMEHESDEGDEGDESGAGDSCSNTDNNHEV